MNNELTRKKYLYGSFELDVEGFNMESNSLPHFWFAGLPCHQFRILATPSMMRPPKLRSISGASC